MTGGSETIILSPAHTMVECSWISDLNDKKKIFRFDFSKQTAETHANHVREAAGEWGQRAESNATDVNDYLAQFLQCGIGLFDAVFQDSDIKKHIEALPPGITIYITNNITSIVIPWGLLYVPGGDGTNTDYLLGIRFNIIALEEGFNRTVDNKFKWVFRPWINGEHYRNCQEKLNDIEKDFSMAIVKHSFFWVDPQVKLPLPPPKESANESNRFIYAYAHHDGNFLEFSHRVKYPPTMLIEQAPGNGGTDVVFINACNTVKSAARIAEYLLTRSSDSNREIVIIATEFDVPLQFAMRFGLEFIDRLTQKMESIKHIMNVMRKKHAPLSVVYALHHLNDWKIINPITLID